MSELNIGDRVRSRRGGLAGTVAALDDEGDPLVSFDDPDHPFLANANGLVPLFTRSVERIHDVKHREIGDRDERIAHLESLLNAAEQYLYTSTSAHALRIGIREELGLPPLHESSEDE